MCAWLTSNSTLISNLALVVVTIFYAWDTHKMALEARESRREGFLPFLFVLNNPNSQSGSGGRTISFQLANQGRGPAFDINIRMDGVHNETIAQAGFSRILSPQDAPINVQFAYHNEEIGNRLFQNPKMHIEYRDIFRRTIMTEVELRQQSRADGAFNLGIEWRNFDLRLPS